MDVEYGLNQWERDVFPLLTEVKPFCMDKFENWMGEHLENKPVLYSLRRLLRKNRLMLTYDPIQV